MDTINVPYINLATSHAPLKDELLSAVARVIDHGMFVMGDEVAEFEHRFAELCEVRYAVGVNSGTDALIMALKALEIGPGDEVITAPNSFIASASCIALVGARPVFVDVGEDYNLDPSLVEQAITPRTRALLPVHLTGRPADMDTLVEIASRHGLHVIEDAAQAVGARYKGLPAGSMGTVGCFSLHPLKTLNACGDGGILTTNDSSTWEQFMLLRNHGLKTRENSVMWGLNSRLDTIQAAILLVKLQYLEEWTERRRRNALLYQQLLEGVPEITTPMDQPYERAVYHTFIIQASRRDALKEFLATKGIGSVVTYPVPLHLQDMAADLGYGEGAFPVAERQADRSLNLPVYEALKADHIEYVAGCVSSFYNGSGR